MTKDKMLSEITRMEAAYYRNVGCNMLGYYTKEPIGYRQNLEAIYSKLSTKDLNTLHNIKVVGFNNLLKLKK
jgi:hypothetical protein